MKAASPYVLTEEELLWARVNHVDRLAELVTSECPVVDDQVTLAEVMSKLVENRKPVIVRNADGDLLGTISDSDVVRALSAVSELSPTS